MNDIQQDLFTEFARNAGEFAAKYRHGIITAEHLLAGALSHVATAKLLIAQGVDVADMLVAVDNNLKKQNNIKGPNRPKEQTLENVIEYGMQMQMTTVVESVFLTQQKMVADNKVFRAADCLQILYTADKWCAYFIDRYGVKLDVLLNAEEAGTTEQNATEILDSFCTNITQLAKNGKIDPIVGRSDELTKIAKILAKRNKRNVLLVGDAGVGKTAIAEGLALNILNDKVPDHLRDHQIWSLDLGSLVAGSKFRGELEEKVKHIFDSLKAHPKSILFIDEAHQIKDAGGGNGQNGPDFASMIKPVLAKGSIKLIASTTWAEYTSTFEKDAALMRRCVVVRVNEPSIAEAKLIMRGLKKQYEDFHHGTITDAALDAAVEYGAKYIPERQLPDKAIDLLDSACATVKSKNQPNWIVTALDIAHEIKDDRGIVVEDLNDVANDKTIIDITTRLNSKIFHQTDAIKDIASKLIAWKAGLKDPSKPIGSFIFNGPSGVGKTQTAKELSKMLGMKLLHYNMSEYSEKHSLAALIGAPPGYVGHGNGKAGDGLLVNDIIKNPNSIILLDEMAGKAHPDICNILLQMSDEGILTSMNGRAADCKNCIIIVSGNLGAQDEANKKNLAFQYNGAANGKTESTKAMQGFFLPELRGRFKAIQFAHLDNTSIRKILIRNIDEIALRPRMVAKKISLLASDELINHFISKNQEKQLGARPFKNDIEDTILPELGTYLLSNPALENVVLKLDWTDNKLSIAEHEFDRRTAPINVLQPIAMAA